MYPGSGEFALDPQDLARLLVSRPNAGDVMVALYEPDAADAIFDDHLASTMRQELPLRGAKTEDRVRPYNPMNGLYIRALVVALLGRAATFWYEGHGS
jgi:hypothetical protein